MKILLLTHSWPDETIKWRGLFIKDQAMAIGISHEIIVVFFRTDYSRLAPFSPYSFSKKEDGNVTVYEITTTRSFPVINQLKYLRDTFRFIRKEILSKHKIDVIHSQLSYPAGFLGTLTAKKTGIPCVITEHSWVHKYFRSPVHRFCVRYALKNCNSIVAVSHALGNDIFQNCRRQVKVIPNVVNIDRFHTVKAPQTGEGFNIGIMGGMGNYRKGLDILIRALPLLEDIDLTVHIGGDGVLLETFRNLAGELNVEYKCIFYGEIKPERIMDFYSRLDAYVLPSRDETFGVVVVEAMACGLPVVASRCGGPEEIITPESGLLVDRENHAQLAEAIRKLCKNIASYDNNAIRLYVTGRYSPAAFVKSITSLYSEITDGCK